MSTKIGLSNSELAVIDSLQDTTQSVSQRELARRTGLSVGLVNAIIKKLVHTGYVKTSHLNRRTIEYLLTPEGFAQAAQKSYHYIADTVRRYQGIRVKLRAILAVLKNDGFSDIYLHGDGELAELIGIFITEELGQTLKRGLPAGDGNCVVVLNAAPVSFSDARFKVVNLVRELGAAGLFTNGNVAAPTPEDEIKRTLQFTK